MADISCREHGEVPYRGHVMCGHCRRLWCLRCEGSPMCLQFHEPAEYNVCDCGSELIGEDGSAVAVCGWCYAKYFPRISEANLDAERSVKH